MSKLKNFGKMLGSLFGGKAVAQPVETKPAPVVRQPDIGCVAKSILEDLDASNPKRLKAKWTKFDTNYYGYTVQNKSKKYTLITKRGGWQSGWSVFLKGVPSFDFNNDEKEAIVKAVESLNTISETERENAQKEKDLKKLQKLFPDCYPLF